MSNGVKWKDYDNSFNMIVVVGSSYHENIKC